MPYHGTTGYRRTDTSLEAALGVHPSTKTMRAGVLLALSKVGPLTADELADYLGMSVLSIRPRFTELKTEGKIADTGERRKNSSGRRAIVWKVAA